MEILKYLTLIFNFFTFLFDYSPQSPVYLSNCIHQSTDNALQTFFCNKVFVFKSIDLVFKLSMLFLFFLFDFF